MIKDLHIEVTIVTYWEEHCILLLRRLLAESKITLFCTLMCVLAENERSLL